MLKRTLALFFLVLFVAGCAPKKVRVYEFLVGVREDLVQTALGLVGKPYRSGAKGPEAFDCSGFVYFVYRKSQIVLPISTEPLIKAGYEIPRTNALPGDLVFFRIKQDLHVGIVLNNNQFIHSSKSKGVIVDDLRAPYWRANVLCFRCII